MQEESEVLEKAHIKLLAHIAQDPKDQASDFQEFARAVIGDRTKHETSSAPLACHDWIQKLAMSVEGQLTQMATKARSLQDKLRGINDDKMKLQALQDDRLKSLSALNASLLVGLLKLHLLLVFLMIYLKDAEKSHPISLQNLERQEQTLVQRIHDRDEQVKRRIVTRLSYDTVQDEAALMAMKAASDKLAEEAEDAINDRNADLCNALYENDANLKKTLKEIR
eukprot:561482-Hanusia_phi.AAC.3